MMIKHSFLFLLLVVFLAACGEPDTDLIEDDLTLEQQIDLLIDNNEYETALSVLDDEDRDDPEIQQLYEKTHLNYGLNSMSTFDESEMRTRMNLALEQFTEVLRINPQNEVAREQIDQIMAVYATIPEREPEEDVLEGLREVGYDY
jgi:ribosome-interacting GTPase 1